jgi:hypothetical protein
MNCRLLPFFAEWRDKYFGLVSTSPQPRQSPAVFQWGISMAFLTAIALFGSVIQGQVNAAPAVRFYINASGPLGNGSGSSAANAADASTPAKYYAINQSHTTPGTVIVYAPGTYLMNTGFSCWNGVAHQGSGIDSTIVKVADSSVPCNTMFTTGGAGSLTNFKFSDATLDLNASHQTWWKNGSGSSGAFSLSRADHCTIERVKFVNFGARNQEAFLIFFVNGNSTGGNLNHNLVDSCIFTQPIRRGNAGGATCIYLADAEPNVTVDNTNVVSNCQFLDLNYPDNSDLTYAQCVTAPQVINNYARGVDALFFIEPGSQSLGNNIFFTGQTCLVSGNTLVNSGMVARIMMRPNGAFAGNLNVSSNSVGMMNNPYGFFGPRGPQGFAIEQYETGNPGVGNLTVQNNTFIAPVPYENSPTAVKATFTAGSGRYFHLASLSILNNRFLNFPKDGNELKITTDPEYNPKYRETGNLFSANSIPSLPDARLRRDCVTSGPVILCGTH